MTRNRAQKIVPFVVGMVLLTILAACGRETKVSDALDAIYAIDAKYADANANFRLEQIGTQIIDEQALPNILADVKDSHSTVMKRAIPDDKSVIEAIYTARESMLTSQIHFQQSKKLGRDAVVKDVVLCKDKPEILEMARLLELTRAAGANASYTWDQVIQELTNRQDTASKDRIGYKSPETGDNRLKWYGSPFREMTLIIERNKAAIAKYCS